MSQPTPATVAAIDLATPESWTEAAFAERFALEHTGRLMFVHARKDWYVFTGHYWKPDRDGQVKRLFLDFGRAEQQRALDIADLKTRKRVLDLAIGFEQRTRMENVLGWAASLRPLADAGAGLDADPMLCGAPNGVIDLRTGTLRPGRPDDRITMSVAVPFMAATPAPRFERFLLEVMNGEHELVDFLQYAFGYSLTGHTSEHCVFIEHGSGANGKSTLNETVSAIFGDYACNAPFSTFELKDRESISTDVARLEGKRFVRASETNDGRRVNEARIKALTGGDMMTARFLHRNHVEFRPALKLWLAVNHKPVVRDDSHGFWRRLRLIPFLQTFATNDRLRVELEDEREGILAWCVRGAVAWHAHRLPMPAAVRAATNEYQQESDPIADFLEECCAAELTGSSRASDVQARYSRWADQQNLPKAERLTSRALAQRLAQRFTRRHTKSGWVYDGLRVVKEGLW